MTDVIRYDKLVRDKMEEAQTRIQAEQENAKATKAQVDELLSWAQCFDKADIGTKHLIVSR